MDSAGLDNLSNLARLGQRKQPFRNSFLHRTKINLTWRNPPVHHWYAVKSPGLSLQCRSSRTHQMALVRFRSSHLRGITFVQGVKSFFTCPCSFLASPGHLLDCWSISLRQLFEDQDLQWGTLNSSRAISPLERLVEGEESVERLPEHSQGVLPQNRVETSHRVLSPAW
ncbi:uncharacterized protein TNCV_2594091 [Trichonephila clavipes]|nr:uncharacterized protein TNCV_2594091 [Trichonephila clavipes]